MNKKNDICYPFFFGVLFSFGLGLSGMMDPVKIQGFLDIYGKWDSTLLWVMLGGILTTMLLFPLILKREKPLFRELFSLPTKTAIDVSLIVGAILFGIGWAVAGMCPGPALANISTWNPGILIFVSAMLLSFFALEKRSLFFK